MQREKRIGRALLMSAAIAFSGGCGQKYISGFVSPGSELAGIRSVAVTPFENLTRHHEAGAIAADLFATELYISKRFQVMERQEVQRKLSDKGITLPESIDPEYAQVIGKDLGVDGVLIGSVSEYWYRVYREEDEDAEPAVGLTSRLVDVETGKVVWASSATRSSYDLLASQKDPLNRVAQIVARQMVETLVEGARR